MEFSNNNPQNKSLAEIREEAYKQGREDAIEEFIQTFMKEGWCAAQCCKNDNCEECESSMRELAEQIKEQMNG